MITNINTKHNHMLQECVELNCMVFVQKVKVELDNNNNNSNEQKS